MSPYSSILYLITGILLATIGVLSFIKDKKSPANRSLFLFSGSIIFWMLALYLGYYFVDPESSEVSTFFIRLTFAFGVFGAFSLCAFAYYYPRKSIPFSKLAEYLFLWVTVFIVFFSAFTNLVYEKEIIVNGVEIEDVHGSFHIMFLLYYLFGLFFAIWISFKKIFSAKGIERNKIILSLVGILSIAISSILFHTILPIFGIYWLQTEVVLFSLVFVALAFYSMVKYRFLDVKLTLTKVFKETVALFLAAIIGYFIYLASQYAFGDLLPFFSSVFIFIIFAIFLYSKFIQFFNSDTFHKFFGLTNVEYFQQVISEFKDKNLAYHRLRVFERDLEKSFCKKLSIRSVRVIALNKKNRERYPGLIRHFRRNHDILVTKEIAFLGRQGDGRKFSCFLELKSLGEVCCPLFRGGNVLIGFFVLGKKQFDDTYSIEEIDALEGIKAYLGLRLTSVLYKESLQDEVTHKTRELNAKNLELAESNTKLKKLDQAKDEFLAIASHELRTPMTVIKGYSDFLLSRDFGSLNKKQEYFLKKVFNNSTGLINLVDKMLDISTLEAGKMEFNFEEVNLVGFIHKRVKEFETICREKKIQLKFFNPENLTVLIQTDPEKLKIVFNNHIGNAYKFTP